MVQNNSQSLIQPHGGYRTLKSFQVSQLIYDITVRFCNRFIPRGSRTHDQMVQAARSGVQNIAEGSQASGTSKSTELRLTNVARASLEELRLDFLDYLRQRNLALWPYNEPLAKELVRLRPTSADDFVRWLKEKNSLKNEDISVLAANGVLVLLDVACSLLDRQIAAQAASFEKEGGFRERLYRSRAKSRKQ